MSDPHMATGPYRPTRYAKRKGHRPVSLDGLPSPEELAQQTHEGEAADQCPEPDAAALADDARQPHIRRDALKPCPP